MRSTAQYRLFTPEPGARRLARARALMHEGRPDDSEIAYRAALTEDPNDRTAWTELFELFRSRSRWEDALNTAEHAAAHFPGEPFPLAIVGVEQLHRPVGRDARDVMAGLARDVHASVRAGDDAERVDERAADGRERVRGAAVLGRPEARE